MNWWKAVIISQLEIVPVIFVIISPKWPPWWESWLFIEQIALLTCCFFNLDSFSSTARGKSLLTGINLEQTPALAGKLHFIFIIMWDPVNTADNTKTDYPRTIWLLDNSQAAESAGSDSHIKNVIKTQSLTHLRVTAPTPPPKNKWTDMQ